MAVVIKELENWFKSRPRWLQDATCRIIQKGTLTNKDYDELFTICLSEANGEQIAFTAIPDGALEIKETTKSLRLESIEEVNGINALCPSKPLEFGDSSLCIVYGRNGTGKSGYVRLLKHICGSKNPGKLLSNVFNASEEEQSAIIKYNEDNKTKQLKWTKSALSELKEVDIYDTHCGIIYVDEENEVAFEPWLLRLFTELTNVCNRLDQQIQSKINLSVTSKPNLPSEFDSTASGTWYNNITPKISYIDVNDKISWSSKHKAELDELGIRLLEINPSAKATLLRNRRKNLVKLISDLKSVFNSLSETNCITYIKAKADVKLKQVAAEQDAERVFRNAPLAGVGSESWKLLWEAARKYSTDQAYTDSSFPNIEENARCVLCQRSLDEEGRERLISFENFVKGELQKGFQKSKEILQAAEEKLIKIYEDDTLMTIIDAAGINDEQTREKISNFGEILINRRETCYNSNTIEEVTALPSNHIIEHLEEISLQLERQASAFDEDAKKQNRSVLQNRSSELSARKWLNQQRKAIKIEIARLVEIEKLERARKLTNTVALSKHKSLLTDDLLTNSYIQRFKNELKSLKADNLRVELKKTRAEVGHVFHRIILQNAASGIKTSEILSEGEFRIVSLAAFLADTQGHDAKTTFIFDDPISSLDQIYEEATAQRLALLSKHRQVIVFTHRLSLVGLLEKYCKKETITPEVVCLSRIKIGDISDLPINLTDTKTTANRFLNERIKEVQRAYQASDAEYEKEAKALCSNIRILLEQIVETNLLNGIVKRYGQEVQTKNKIEHLAKITIEDCKFIDELMTFYSQFEHSQSDETPIELPKPEKIEEDLKAIVEFIKKLKKRNNN